MAAKLIGYPLLALGVGVCACNFYLSLLRYPLHRLFAAAKKYKHISIIPLVGSGMVIGALLITNLPHWMFLCGVVLALLDTGGLHWFIGSVAFHGWRRQA